MKIFLKSILNFVLNPFLSRLKNKNLESLDKSIILNAKKLMQLFNNIKSYYPKNSKDTKKFILEAYKNKGPNFISLKADKSINKF